MKVRGLGASIQSAVKLETSVRFPKKLRTGIKISMEEGGYGTRERSRWICEAVCFFYEKHMDETAAELSGTVSLFSSEYGEKKSLPVIISGDSLAALKKMMALLRKAPSSKFNPTKNQSDVILASCLNRLITEKINLLSI